MVSRIMAAVDAEYAEVTRVRIRRAMRQLAAEGRPNGGRVLGYVSAVGEDVRKTRAVVPHEAEAIRWAATELLRGETLASVAGRWDEMGRAGRRAILARVFERIEVRRATARGYDPERIKLTWRNPAVAAAVTAPPGTRQADSTEESHHALR